MLTSDHPFDLLVQADDGHIRLAEAALLYAADHNPNLKARHWLERLDALARRVERLRARTPRDQYEALRLVLVDQEGFRGNRKDYYDPRNSLLNQVMDRRTGIPITLAAIWTDVAGQLGWPVVGVSLPGHFVIRWDVPCEELIVDTYDAGKLLDIDDCRALASEAAGRPVRLGPQDLEPSPVRATLTRMLNNLCVACGRRQAWANLARALLRLIALHPRSDELRRQLDTALGNLARTN